MNFLIYFKIFNICLITCLATTYSDFEVIDNENEDLFEDKNNNNIKDIGLLGVGNLNKLRPFTYNIWKNLLEKNRDYGSQAIGKENPLKSALRQRTKMTKIRDGIRF